MPSGYLVYVVLGCLPKDWSFNRWQRAAIYAFNIAGVALRYFETIITSDRAGELVPFLWGYTNLPCFLEGVDLAWRMVGPVVAYLLCLGITYVGKHVSGTKLLFP
ncbi:hypothetical protein [Paratractidigestivibacter sp.]|uniref:hypothetical protein n=1 Tax=Paratractidigestivibacter sp. TaxID=2847316 RepID=UPI002ABDB1DC|nr:hypothetical protein [Paratractidigestivibacter sp.]